MAGPAGNRHPGEEVVVSDAEGASLVDGGYAVAMAERKREFSVPTRPVEIPVAVSERPKEFAVPARSAETAEAAGVKVKQDRKARK